MTWEYYEDLYGAEPQNTEEKPRPNFNGLILLGLGLLGGYLLFSKDENKEKEEAKPLDSSDKAIANKIDFHVNPNFIFGGKGDNLSIADVDKDQLKKGMAVEMEHTNKKEIAQEIALDHLAEDKKYYTKLEGIHKENPSVCPLKIETLNDIRDWARKARSIYGKSVLPLMKNEDGSPSEIAMQALELGCEIPKTKKMAKEISRKATQAMQEYKKLKKSGLKKNDKVDFKI